MAAMEYLFHYAEHVSSGIVQSAVLTVDDPSAWNFCSLIVVAIVAYSDIGASGSGGEKA